MNLTEYTDEIQNEDNVVVYGALAPQVKMQSVLELVVNKGSVKLILFNVDCSE